MTKRAWVPGFLPETEATTSLIGSSRHRPVRRVRTKSFPRSTKDIGTARASSQRLTGSDIVSDGGTDQGSFVDTFIDAKFP